MPGVVPKYNWTYPAILTIAREEGVAALYKGFVPKVLRLAPGGGVLLLVVEFTLGIFRKGAKRLSPRVDVKLSVSSSSRSPLYLERRKPRVRRKKYNPLMNITGLVKPRVSVRYVIISLDFQIGHRTHSTFK